MAINSGRDTRFCVSFVVACVISLAMSGTVLAGNSLRSFEADPNVTVIDDFESYTNDSPNLLWETWIDGTDHADRPGNGSGAIGGIATTIVHGGNQSMCLCYNNSELPYYSEAQRTYTAPQDWLRSDANSLSLWLRGTVSNSPDSIYLSLEDNAGNKVTTIDPNSQTVSLEEWQQWVIPLTAFTTAGVDVNKVSSIRLGIGSRTNPHPAGSGIIYADDIEVRRAGSSLPGDLVEVAGASYASLTGLAAGSAEAQACQAQAVQQLRLPLEVKTANTGIVLRLIPAGTFMMGSPTTEVGRYSEEVQHQVTLTKAFYCGKFEVTQGQWQQVTGTNPSDIPNAGLEAPVEHVSWDDGQTFLKKLCQIEGVPEGTYRLLTEAEWEYACRGGTQTRLYNGDLVILGLYNGPALDPIAYYGGNCGVEYAGGCDSSGWREKQYNHTRAGTHPVGQKAANAYGLHDMIGNVWEWCQDWYAPYASAAQTDPVGPASGGYRVYRGGSWYAFAKDCRSANHGNGGKPGTTRYSTVGFRLARTTSSLP
jgi:formylglycine-generating enzyme required for sulfatase activity